jgi:threonine-phosphate decarboxylase
MTHGGNVQRVARELGILAECILDFSANVNPRGLPARAAERLARDARDPRVLSQYPDPEAHELRTVLSRKLDVPPECIVIGAGADALIHAAVRALAPRRCVISIPAFGEYARAATASGCAVHTVPLASREIGSHGDLVVLNNPHNPTGVLLTRAEMLHRIDDAQGRGASVLLDEAFIDYSPDDAVTRETIARPGVVSIRSLTKFYGCPGLRVGYAVASPDTAAALAIQLPAWPVTTLAMNALAEAIQDAEYTRETLELNERNRMICAEALERLGCEVSPSAANFLFVRLPDSLSAAQVRERLLREHAVLVRECDSFEGIERGRYFRVAVREEIDNARLIQALTHVFKGWSC